MILKFHQPGRGGMGALDNFLHLIWGEARAHFALMNDIHAIVDLSYDNYTN